VIDLQCPFCKKENKHDNKNFDNSRAHAVIILRDDGAIHVHAPFGDPTMIKNFIEKFILEAEKNGIIYKHRL